MAALSMAGGPHTGGPPVEFPRKPKLSGGGGAHRAAAVVAAELVAVRLVVVPRLVELRRVLDLVLRAVDEDRLRIRVDVTNQAGRDHQLLAEDPGTGVDDDEAAADLPGRLVDLADLTVGRLDLEAGEVDVRRCLAREGPH